MVVLRSSSRILALVASANLCSGCILPVPDKTLDSTTEPDVPGDPGELDAEDVRVPCDRDEDCNDGQYCNGEEMCGPEGFCLAGTDIDCSDSDPCTMDVCDEPTNACTNPPLDEDGDGHIAEQSPGGDDCGGDDCDDSRDDTYPEAEEICVDGIDQDCDDIVDGIMLIGDEIRVTDADGASTEPTMAWSGSEFGLGWTDGRDGTSEIYFTVLSATGEKSLPDIRMSGGTGLCQKPVLQWSGSEYGLAYCNDGDVYFSRVSTSGEKLGTETKVSNNGQCTFSNSLSWTGSEYAVLWQTNQGLVEGTDQGVYFSRLLPNASKIGEDQKVATRNNQLYSYTLGWSGSNFLFVWSEGAPGVYGHFNTDRISAVFLDTGGVRTGTELEVYTETAHHLHPRSVVWTGTEYVAMWTDIHYGMGTSSTKVLLGRFTGGGEQVGENRLAALHTAYAIHQATLSWDGTMLAVLYNHGPLTLIRWTPSLEDYSPEFEVRVGGDDPAILWTGSEFGASLRSDQEIYFERIGFCE